MNCNRDSRHSPPGEIRGGFRVFNSRSSPFQRPSVEMTAIAPAPLRLPIVSGAGALNLLREKQMAKGLLSDPDWTAAKVASVLSYDPETGVLRWVAKLSNRAPIGSKAGWRENGYIKVKLFGRKVFAHRLAWLLQTGAWPETEIDHRDLDGSNNRWGNLRPATRAQNGANKGLQANNTTGFKGVFWHKGAQKFMSQIGVEGRIKYLGLFDTAEEAHRAYCSEADELYGEFRRQAA